MLFLEHGVAPLAEDKYEKGIGTRSVAGSATWASTDEPTPQSMEDEPTVRRMEDEPTVRRPNDEPTRVSVSADDEPTRVSVNDGGTRLSEDMDDEPTLNLRHRKRSERELIRKAPASMHTPESTSVPELTNETEPTSESASTSEPERTNEPELTSEPKSLGAFGSAPVVNTHGSSETGLLDQLVEILNEVGETVLGVGRFVLDRIMHPLGKAVSKQWKVIRDQVRMEDRLVDGDTYDADRARDWEKFQKGKRSSSYLQDDSDKES